MRTLPYLALSAALSLSCFECGISDPHAGSGSQTSNSNCVGTIFNTDGTAAPGAVVRIIPDGYDPTAPSAPQLDSTFTDANGRYAFMVGTADYYTITAEKGDKSCKQDSIPVQPDGKTIVDSDTLEASGRLAGSVLLKPGDDPRSPIVLVLGTNVYTTPSDSIGTFATPLLPAGSFSVRIFTTESGYGIVDTTIVIRSGETTELIVTLPYEDAPAVKGFSATFDSVAMRTTLRWSPADTAAIKSYMLCRVSRCGNDTMMVIDRVQTSFVDDVIECEGDTLTYTIATIAGNSREGYKTFSPVVLPSSVMRLTKTIEVPFDYINAGYQFSSIDQDENFYFIHPTGMIKIDLNGIVIGRYSVPKPSELYICGQGPLQHDDSGNVYCLTTVITEKEDRFHIVKLSANLAVLEDHAVDDSLSTRYSCNLAVSGNGTMFLIADSSSPDHSEASITRILIYNGNFNLKNDERTHSEFRIMNCIRFGNRFVTTEYNYLHTPTKYVTFRDESFKVLTRSNNLCTHADSSREQILSTSFTGGPFGRIIQLERSTRENSTTTELYASITDTSGGVLGRKMIGTGIFDPYYPAFDNTGSVYLLMINDIHNRIVLNRYSIDTIQHFNKENRQ